MRIVGTVLGCARSEPKTGAEWTRQSRLGSDTCEAATVGQKWAQFPDKYTTEEPALAQMTLTVVPTEPHG